MDGKSIIKEIPDFDEAWRKNAACRGADPDLFYPTGTTGLALEQTRAAKAVCRACDVQPACLQFALETNQEHGIWGGTAEDERRRIRRNWLAHARRTRNLTNS